MLSTRVILEHDGVEISDVACRHVHGRGVEEASPSALRLVFVRRGAFVRSADGRERLHDPTSAFWMSPGEAQRYDHPHGGGDDCTSIAFTSEHHLEALADQRGELPRGIVQTTPRVDAEHRLLLAAAVRADGAGAGGAEDLVERALGLAADALAQARAQTAQTAHLAARAGAASRRAALADGAREALAADPELSLRELARLLSVSEHHLSRTFRSVTGHTIARHRMRLRARSALELLAGGERDLARVAADTGFADQSHLCRVMRAEAARTPAALRALLRA